jgi:2,4-dienoyl-CoA reductase-like NADH-dependent reductase (Old Yellow Enzyme family)
MDVIMNRVEMIVAGRRALVDADMVKKMTRKQQLVAHCTFLQDKMDTEKDPVCFRLLSEAVQENVQKIVRLNRTIRQNVYFFPLETV